VSKGYANRQSAFAAHDEIVEISPAIAR